MSIILVKKEKNQILIGADSQETINESHKENVFDSKLRKIENEVYLAGAGDGHICSMLYAYAEKNSLLDITSSWLIIEYFSQFNEWLSKMKFSNIEEGENYLYRCQFLLIIKDRVWQFSDFYTREIKDNEFAAIGSGTQAAMACSKLNDSIEEILNAVCKVDIYCSLPFKILEIKINNK